MKVCFSFLITLWCYVSVLAQVAQPSGKLKVNTSPGGIIEEINTEEAVAAKGSIYLNEEWAIGTIFFRNGETMINTLLKYDLKNHVFKIKYDNRVKAIQEIDIEKFEFTGSGQVNTVYVNANQYRIHGAGLSGFFEIKEEGKLGLLSLVKLRMIKPNYVPTHDAGEKAARYIVDRQLYFLKSDEVFPVPGNKSKIMTIFEDKKEVIQNFIKENNLKLKRSEDLIQVVEYYNSQK